MWILRIPISLAVAGFVVSSSSNIFCSAIRRPTAISGGASVRARERNTPNNQDENVEVHGFWPHQWPQPRPGEENTQIHGNPVVTQVVPPSNPEMRGQFFPDSPRPTNSVIKAALSAMIGYGVIRVINNISALKMFNMLPFDWKTTFGALVTSLLVSFSCIMTFSRGIPIFDGLRGVDRNKGNPRILEPTWMDKKFGIKVMSTAPPPLVGLVLAAGITAKVLVTLSNRFSDVCDGTTAAGRILLIIAGLNVFGSVLMSLPKTIPDTEYYLPEVEMAAMHTMMRYCLLPIWPVVNVVARLALYVISFKIVFFQFSAMDKIGKFRMDVTHTDTVGKPVGFSLAEDIRSVSDRTLSRSRVSVENYLDNFQEWCMRKPVRRDDVLVPTDEQIWSMCSKTVLSYNIMDEIKGDELLLKDEKCLDMTPLQFFETLADYHYTVARVYLRGTKYDDERMPTRGIVTRIVMNDGAVIRPGDEHWDIAKLHFIATANLFFPAMQHNWVHFNFVDCATAMAKSIIPRGSFLMDIMEPYILSNVNTNGNGLGGLVTSADPSVIWKNVVINPTSQEFFTNSIRHRSLAFYTGESNYVLSDDVLLERVKFGFPPVFKDDETVPYLLCLKKSYDAFRVFARKVVDIISEDSKAIETFRYWCNEVVRRTSNKILAANVDHVDILATMMWQVSILHSLDHNAYFHWMEPMNGGSGTRCDYKAQDARENIYTADDVRVYRQFTNVAGKYVPGKPDDSLAGVKHIYEGLSSQRYPQKNELVNAFTELQNKLTLYIEKYINEPSQGRHPGIHLDLNLIASAILT